MNKKGFTNIVLPILIVVVIGVLGLGYFFTNKKASQHPISSPPAVSQSSSNTTPSISVISPNGGESWKIASIQTIRWNPVNIPAGTMVDIKLLNKSSAYPKEFPGNELSFVLATGVENTGTYNWPVGKSGNVQSIPVGDYFVQVAYERALKGGAELVSGLSSSPFSITVPPTQ